MEGDLQGSVLRPFSLGCIDKGFDELRVQHGLAVSVSTHAPKDHAVNAERASTGDVIQHHRLFPLVIDKVTTARTNHSHDLHVIVPGEANGRLDDAV